VPFRTQGYFINMGRQLSFLILRSRVIICIIKAGKYSRKGVIVCRGIQSAYKMGSIPYLSTRLFIDEFFARREFDSPQLHKSKTVYVVDGVASRYTNSRTYGVAWF
jgi:hypothetical protein